MSQSLSFLSDFGSVTNTVSFAAFAVAALVGLYAQRNKQKHKERVDAIEKGGDEALRIASETATILDIDTKSLTRAQLFELAKNEQYRHIHKQKTTTALAIVVILVSGIVIGVALMFGGSDNRVKEDQLIRDIRTGTPAARSAALLAIQEEFPNNGSDFHRRISRELIASQGKELCNLLLAASDVAPALRVSDLLQTIEDSPEHQLENPVCTSESRPDFSGVSFSDIAFVRPNLSNANFTRAVFDEVTFRDDPDYSGQESSECSIIETDFIGAVLRGSSFAGCRLARVSFNSAELLSVTFLRSTLDRVNFKFGNLEAVKFLGARLKHVDLRTVGSGGEVIFSPSSSGSHVRMNYDLALSIQNILKNFEPVEVISGTVANQCWDLVSEDSPECRELAKARTYVVCEDDQLDSCKAWAAALPPRN